MFALFYTFLYINDVKYRIHVLAKPQRSSLRIHLCASERSERAIFWVFNSFTVKKVNFITIHDKFKVILSSKSVGGYLYRPPPAPQKLGSIHPPPPGLIYASDLLLLSFENLDMFNMFFQCHNCFDSYIYHCSHCSIWKFNAGCLLLFTASQYKWFEYKLTTKHQIRENMFVRARSQSLCIYVWKLLFQYSRHICWLLCYIH